MSKGHLRKVSLLLARVVVELVDSLLEMGMITTVYCLVLSAILVSELTFVVLCFPQICQAFGSNSFLLQPTDLRQGLPSHLFLLQRFRPPHFL